jgi:hypothetical protein
LEDAPYGSDRRSTISRAILIERALAGKTHGLNARLLMSRLIFSSCPSSSRPEAIQVSAADPERLWIRQRMYLKLEVSTR